jgi:hypothetical protein
MILPYADCVAATAPPMQPRAAAAASRCAAALCRCSATPPVMLPHRLSPRRCLAGVRQPALSSCRLPLFIMITIAAIIGFIDTIYWPYSHTLSMTISLIIDYQMVLSLTIAGIDSRLAIFIAITTTDTAIFIDYY